MRCAHYPPPCLRGSLAHPVCQVSFAVAFPGFWDVKIMIFEDFGRSKWRFLGHFGRPGASWEGPGAIFKPKWVPWRKMTKNWKPRTPPGPPPNGACDALFAVCFFMFFRVIFFFVFLWFWVPRDSILGTFLTPFWEPWTSEKTAKTVILSAFFKVWPLPGGVFLYDLLASAFWWRVFADFNDFTLIWGSHLETFCALIAWKKKSAEKGAASTSE